MQCACPRASRESERYLAAASIHVLPGELPRAPQHERIVEREEESRTARQGGGALSASEREMLGTFRVGTERQGVQRLARLH